MDRTDTEGEYVEQLIAECCGGKAAVLRPPERAAFATLFADVLWHEGIEALTPERLDILLDFVSHRLPRAA
ncbi:hypothetical protein [Azospirillum sp. ST 5-10]|uniref:hypothetical protein n=1 Tax=unclassified Azospirillum TaxID=2630922 RepID=UPI003F49B5D5